MLYRAKAAGRNQVMTDGEGATKTLLTINSDRHALNLLHQQLGSTCTIVTAENCFEFLDLAYHIQPDLLLLEADNPALDAERLCRALRQAPQTVDIPILLLADHSREPADLQQLGVDACLLNPLDDVQIETRIRNYLR
jgi:PleD family two-component response regulator